MSTIEIFKPAWLSKSSVHTDTDRCAARVRPLSILPYREGMCDVQRREYDTTGKHQREFP